MSYNPHRALELLRQGTGRADSVFRENQEEAIRHVVDCRGLTQVCALLAILGMYLI